MDKETLGTIVENQVEKILAENEFGSPVPADRTTRLVDYFYEKLYWKLVGVSALGSGTILSVNTAILMPTESVSDWALKPFVVGMSFIGGGIIGGLSAAMTGMAGGVLVSEWKNISREFNKTINRYIF